MKYKTFKDTLRDITESTKPNSDLQEAYEVNEKLLRIIEALCEHFDLDTQMVLEDVTTPARDAEQGEKIAKIIKRKPSGANEDEIRAISQRTKKEQEDRTRVFGVGGRVTGRTPTGKEVYKARRDRSDRLAPITKREQNRRGF